jgi:hypothetical protein
VIYWLAAVQPWLPLVRICRFCGVPDWLGARGCLVDVTSYQFGRVNY